MKMSLGEKIFLLIIAFAVLLNGTSVFVSGNVIKSMIDEEYINDADDMAATVAVAVDGDRMQKITDKVMEIYHSSDNKLNNEQCDEPGFEDYAEQFLYLTEDEDYIEIREQLRKIQDVNDVDCVYTLCICPEDKTAVYIVDGAYDEEEIVTPGLFDLVEKSCYPYLNDLSQGFPAFITNTKEYGWVVTACMPIYNSKGEIVCFSAVDIDMNEVVYKENKFLIMLSVLLLFLTIVLCIFSILYVRTKIVKPINMLSDAAGQYGQKQFNDTRSEFESLSIHTGDELEILLRSMIQMEKDIDSYIDNLTQTREQLSNARQQADDMHELAHMDALTGIRNKLAYDKEIARLDKEIQDGLQDFGIAMIDLNFLKVINDTYGHEYGNLAIVSLSKLVCRIFAHSPVFRIGGDEFVVILKNNDYFKIKELEKKFNDTLEQFQKDNSLNAWEKISASFGYATFDEEMDHCADDVFKRADYNMYERKKAMKAIRKT